MSLILGSSSDYRAQVLRSYGYSFLQMRPDFDERSIRDANPHRLTLLLAFAKAHALMQAGLPEGATALLTSDQVVVHKGEIREKSRDSDEARRFLEGYHQHPPETVTAIYLINLCTGAQVMGTDPVKVLFRRMPSRVIDRYVLTDSPFSCSGGFDHDHELLKPYIGGLEGIGTSDELDTSVTGMPIRLLVEFANILGII